MNGDYRQVKEFVDVFRRRSWAASATAGIFRLAVLAGVIVLLHALVLEKIQGASWGVFAVALLGSAVFWLSLARTLLIDFKPLAVHDAARRIEKLRPDLKNDIVSSIDLSHRIREGEDSSGPSPALIRALVSSTGKKLDMAGGSGLVDLVPLKNWAFRFCIVALPIAVAAVFGGGISTGSVRAVGDPSLYWPLGKVFIDVEPGEARVLRGGELTVTARVTGNGSPQGMIHVAATGESDVKAGMNPEGDGFYSYRIDRIGGDFAYQVSAGRSSSPWYGVTAVEPPKAGNFDVTYTYPAYTGLKKRKAAGNGDLEALPGTAIEAEFTVNRELSGGRVLIGEEAYEIRKLSERRYGASFYVGGERTYRLALTDMEGFTGGEDLDYSIRYLTDANPTVEVIAPEGETEMDVFSQLRIAYRALDDFGISRLSLVYRQGGGEEKRLDIHGAPAGGILQGEYYWDLGGLDVSPGEVINAFLEVLDSDTISGPKAGHSALFSLRMTDPRVRHDEIAATLEEVTDELVDLLGEELDMLSRYEELTGKEEDESDIPWEKMDAAGEQTSKAMEMAEKTDEKISSLMEKLARDSMSSAELYFQMEMLDRLMSDLREKTLEPMGDVAGSMSKEESRKDDFRQKTDFLKDFSEEAVKATEQMLLMAEQMQREQSMADVQDSGQEMMDRQNSMMEKLEELSPEDREGMKDVLREIAELEKMIGELMEMLSKESEELPEEFLNSDALENLPLQEIMEGLQEIREKLQSGDIEGARKAAQEMMKKLSELMNRLQQAGEEFEQRTSEALRRLKSSTMPEMEKLIREQQAVLNETRELDGRVRKKELQAAVGGEKEGGGEDSPEPGEGMMGGEEKKQAMELALREEELSARSAALAEETAALKAVLPFLDTQVEEGLKNASSYMETAKQELDSSQPGKAVGPENAALAELMTARNKMLSSMREMASMQQLRKGGMGVPIFLSRSGKQMPGMKTPFPDRSQRPGGNLGIDVRNFQLPSREDYKVPRIFRQEILKSLREGYPEHYEERIKDYFHRITE